MLEALGNKNNAILKNLQVIAGDIAEDGGWNCAVQASNKSAIANKGL